MSQTIGLELILESVAQKLYAWIIYIYFFLKGKDRAILKLAVMCLLQVNLVVAHILIKQLRTV